MSTGVSKYFTKKDNTFILNTNKCVALIPDRFLDFKFCTIEEDVTTFGIIDLVFNDTELRGLLLPNFITLSPKEIDSIVIDEKKYIRCTFHKGDIFMKNNVIIKNKFLIIKMFKEFIGFGNLPRFVNYDNVHLLFASVDKMAGMSLNIDHTTLEMVWAYLYRLKKDYRIQARFGASDLPKEFIGLRNVSYGPDSTSAKIFGSHMSDGLNSALVNPNEVSKPLEDIMRL